MPARGDDPSPGGRRRCRATDPSARAELLSFAVVGVGPTGVDPHPPARHQHRVVVRAELAGAVAQSYLWLLVSRLALGAVVAMAGPAVASLIGDYFRVSERGRIYGRQMFGQGNRG
ncbi:MAG: hypothetical protein ACRD0J_07955, partial [Acidimicrobiales bacterium]